MSKEKVDEMNVVLVFLSEFGKRILRSSDTFLMDGTFSTAPDQFSQLYVVFGSGGGPRDKIYPCAYMLLPNKKAVTYTHALQVLKNNVGHSPDEIYIDFEQAAVKSIRKVFPNCAISGCLFHWKKNLFSHVGLKGCLPLFYDDEHFAVGLDILYTISMVPVENVVEAFNNIVIPFFLEHFPKSEEVDDFLNYVEGTYIGRKLRGGERGNPLFSIEMWNIRERVLQDKQTTNNAVESWNARWNNSIGTNHNILSIITGFKNEDALARTKFQQVVAGRATNPNPARKDRRSGRLEMMKLAMGTFTRENMKEFMFMLREDI